MVDFCKDFASHIDSSKKKENQHHKPFKESPIEINVTDLVTSDIGESTISFSAVSTNIVTAKNKRPNFSYSSCICQNRRS